MKKRLLLIVLAICMVMILSCGTVFAENEIIASGECGAEGDNLTWALDSKGVLTISGQGNMENYSGSLNIPWFDETAGLTHIKKVIIESGVTNIGEAAFFSCSNLTSVDIPNSVIKIEKHAFNACSSLTSITVPNSVVSIGDCAFSWCTSLKTIEIPDSVTSFGVDVFSNCSNLINVIIPDSMTTIPYDTFANCSSLTYVNIPSGVTQIGTYAFYGCSNLTGVSIPDSVTDIGEYAFCGCSKLTDIEIPNSVTSIGSYAFCGCNSLRDVTIPSSVTSIGGQAFGICASLSEINVDSNNSTYASLDGVLFNKALIRLIQYPTGRLGTSYDIPDSVTIIGSYAFQGCGNLIKMIIPEGVTNIEQDAFADCSNLASITILGRITTVELFTFKNCENLSSVILPDSVTSIGVSAFSHCSSLTNLPIPDSVTHIGSSAFEYCDGLTTIIIPSNVALIDGSYIFGWCKNLTNVTISSNMTFIEALMFHGCDKLSRVNIPTSVTDIKHGAFDYCPALADIYYSGSKAQWDEVSIDAYQNQPLLDATIHCIDDQYNVTYDANGGTGTMADTLIGASEMYTFPACGFTAPTGKQFKAWQINGEKYVPGNTCTITGNTTVTAVWQDVATTPTQPVNPSDPVTKYTLTGIITGHKGVTYTSVTAQLVGQDGLAYSAEVGAGVTDKTGKTEYTYTVSAPAGQYNLNVTATTAAGSVVNRTAAVNLTGDGQTQNINLPNGQASSSGSSSGNSSNNNYSISIPTNANGGTVTVSPSNARAGATVTITASPNKGYELESIVVKDPKGNSIAVTEVGNGKYTFTMPSSSVSVSAAFVAAAPAPVTTFIDVEPGAYYADAVAWAVENGITSGTGDGKFSPNEPCTRSQIVTFLWRAAGCPEVDITTAFIDVAPGSYYEKAVAWAVANGITNGAGDGKFSPNEPCTRAQAVTFLYRAKGSPSADEGSFSDVGSGLWYTDAVSWAVANGITNGTGNGRFSPDDICTRGQIVTFLYRDMA